ncbi:MAG: hybrid sensor histidine kinase/response regulator [Ramlibacter sp.]|nr:hybrid sensor histidine kinase/response regulator [Ramlibacter sp.]
MPQLPEVNVLIVDDLPENLLALEALIRQPQLVVHQAGSAEQALALLLDHDFALAILDVQMPGMNGFELAEAMRGTGKTRHIPIVFVSAAGSELNYAFKGYESGAIDFLQKPLDTHAVRSKVNVFVELHRQRKLLKEQVAALQQARREQDALLGKLEVAHSELERAVAMRDDFISLVTQELRTPLNDLYVQTQMRKTHLPSGDSPAFAVSSAREMLDREERQIGAMLGLIDGMLDVSRLRTGELTIHPRPLDLAVLVRRAGTSHAARLEAAGCEVTLDAPASVQGVWDEFRIDQIISNLLINAAQHAPGRPVGLSLSSGDGEARLVVRDHGPGIAPRDHERVFRQFERGTPLPPVPGLGLGLYIAQQAARAHGGSVSLDSTPGEGATFTVRLPLAGTP